jgi:UrcA family protein
MTHTNVSTILRRVSERFTASVGALALTTCLFAISDAQAATADSVQVGPTVTVKFERSALDSSDGAAQVYRKLKSAARKVCGVNTGHVALDMRIAQQECFDAALADAVRKVDRPLLSSLHQAATTRRVS